jgi:tetratricopeptide (TPR) repeat protein
LYDEALEIYFGLLYNRFELTSDLIHFISVIYNDIGIVYKLKCDYDRALEWYFKSLAFHEISDGHNSPSGAMTISNIADCYYNLKNYSKAIEWNFEALQIRQDFGIMQNDVAMSYNNIASCYEALGDTQEAIKNYQDAIKFSESNFPDGHIITVNQYSNLACLYSTNRLFKESNKYYLKCVNYYKINGWTEFFILANFYCEIGNNYLNIGNIVEATNAFLSGLKICENNIDKTSNVYIRILKNLIKIYGVAEDESKYLKYKEKLSVFLRETER